MKVLFRVHVPGGDAAAKTSWNGVLSRKLVRTSTINMQRSNRVKSRPMKPSSAETRTETETAQVRDEALFRALNTPPKPKGEKTSAKKEKPAPKGGPKVTLRERERES